MNDDEFLQRFESCTFPHSEWHHREHVKLAYLYAARFGHDIAAEKLRAGIRAYNAANNVQDMPTSGYHETMTQAWMRLVHLTLSEFGPSESADLFVDQHSQLLSKRALLFFYSRDRIMSAEAKRKFVAPDLTPLPQSRRRESA